MADRTPTPSTPGVPAHTLPVHTRSSDHDDLPHATKRKMADHLRKFESMFTLTPQRMRMIVEAFKESLELGLAKPGQVVPMIPTFVLGWPSGQESGNFLAVDLGGTNLRVCLVSLEGGGKFEITQSKYRLTEEQKAEDGQALLDFCGECLKTFIDSSIESGAIGKDEICPLALQFSPHLTYFSYPCLQNKIDHGELLRWTKGFSAPNIETSLAKYVSCGSYLRHNGTLIASHYVNPETKIACIFGTGCNAAYMERSATSPKMAINCEWGAFDSFEHEHLPRTKTHIGRYLGEILRLIICELIDEGVLDPTDELLMIIGIFSYFFAVETTLAERQFFRALAKLVGRRAARLSACGIAAIVSKMGYLETGCSVGADGSLYNKYPGFADRVHEGLRDIFGEKGRNIVTYHAEDGSGIGSAIVAGMLLTMPASETGSHIPQPDGSIVAPVINWYSDSPEDTAIEEGVAGCETEVMVAEREAESSERRSY
ncbi:hypothetical protein BC629DRAFT_1578523 [Irpex lacteus]|nr:hypothetical protein BC629DRAFT_1578523 [Irpex lacteus]